MADETAEEVEQAKEEEFEKTNTEYFTGEQLMGNLFWNDIAYIQEQLVRAMGIPKSYLGYNDYSDTIESEEDFENKRIKYYGA